MIESGVFEEIHVYHKVNFDFFVLVLYNIASCYQISNASGVTKMKAMGFLL